MKTPARAAAEIADNPIRFYVKKKNVRPMLVAIQGAPPSPYNPRGTPGLADRDDVSGKFARKVGQNRRALAAADEQILAERKELTFRHAEKFPEGHEHAGEPTPVYAQNEQGQPIFKKDKAGNDTEERAVLPDQYNLADRLAFERDFTELLEEYAVIECRGFTVDDFNSFKTIAARIVDPLADLEIDGPCTATTADKLAALEALSARVQDEIDALAHPVERTLTLERADHADGPQEEERSAP